MQVTVQIILPTS